MNIATFRSQRAALALTMVLVLGGVAAHGQRPQGGGAGGTMSVDFRAVTADGKPVTDLTPADLTVKIGGKVRTVTGLTLKTIAPAAGAPAAAAPTGASAPFVINDAKPKVEGRSILIVIDNDSLLPGTEPQIRQAVDALLNGLTSADRVAFSVVPRDTSQVAFTGDISAVRAAVAAFKSQRPANVTTTEALCRSRDSLQALHGLMAPLAGRETPSSVVFIAASLSTPANASSATAGSCEVTKENYQAILTDAAEARANVYVIQADAGALGRDSGLENLAGVTGAGQVLRVVGDGFAPRVLGEASTYWVATIAGEPTDRPGQHQQLDVKAVRAGVTVNARPEFAVPRPSAAAAKPGAASPKDMIATKAEFTDLQLQATAVVQRGAAEKMNVLVFAAPVDPAVKITAMRLGYFDAANKGASLDAPQIATLPITTVIPLGVGQYRIRVAATDASGKSGAVDLEVNTNLTPAGPLKLSGLLLGAPNDKGALTPRLVYSSEEKLLAFFYMYGQPTAQVTAKFELAKTDAGPALKTFQPAGGGATEEPDKIQVFGEIPIKDLEPGDYVVRVVVQMEGAPEGKIMKTFRKTAK